MKKYLPKIMTLLVVIGLFVVAINLDIPQDINKYATSVIADSKMEGDCTSGTGKIRYVSVSADSILNIRTGPGTNYEDVGDYNRCTLVTVYCTEGSWGKISKTSDLWVSTDYLKKELPSGCSNGAITTTTKKITFNMGNAETTPAKGMDQMYSNKEGTIKIPISNVKTIANDDVNLISVKVKLDGEDKTDDFEVKRSFENGSGTITLTQSNTKMAAGKYTVEIKIGGSDTQSKSFTIVGKYYDFSIRNTKAEKGELCFWSVCFDSPDFYNNVEHKWTVEINNLVDATDYSEFDYVIMNNGKDQTSKFNITKDGDKKWIIKNKTDDNRPAPGVYRFYLRYQDEDYSTARGVLEEYFDITIAGRYIVFERERLTSNRYTKTQRQLPYTIDISRMQKVGQKTYISFVEEGKTYNMPEDEFKSIYTDMDLLMLNPNPVTGYLEYAYAADCTVTGMTATTITYIDASNITTTVPYATIDALHPNLRTEMKNIGYTYDASGLLHFTKTGTKLLVERILGTKNQTVFAETGGLFTFVYNYEKLDRCDFERASIYIQKDDGTRYDESDGFKFYWGTITDTQVTMHLDYTGESADNIGNYSIYITFNEAGQVEVPFALYDGEIDYYLTAQVDAHYNSDAPLETAFPPGNMDYEWYLGFYLMKGGQQVTSDNPKMIEVDIYDYRADLDSDGKMYFYEQVDYEVHIKTFKDNSITYEVREGDATEFVSVTEPYVDFKAKYDQVAELIDEGKYNFNATTGAIQAKDNFDLHIERFYVEEGMTDNVIIYTDSAGVRHTDQFTDFRVEHPDMFGYVVTRFVYDDDGYIIPGAVMGNYRVTEINGKKIEGRNLDDLFDIEPLVGEDKELDKSYKILPKTEVPAGIYYVYVTYDNLQGVGFVNNSDEAVISKELYPEMWNQNIHMTSIEYLDPVYRVDIEDPTYSNIGNDAEKIYANIEGTARFNIDYHFIHDFSGLSYTITRKTATGNVDASSAFNVISSIDPNAGDYYNVEDPYMILTTKPNQVVSGTYVLTINYKNGNFKAPTATKEFTISGKYYGLEAEDNEIEFIHNYSETKNILIKATYVDNPQNIVPSIERIVAGNNVKLTHDPSTKSFKQGNTVFFTYETEVYDDYYPEDPNAILYEVLLKNVTNVTLEGDYVMSFDYIEGSNDATNTTKEFSVGPDQYHFEIGNETAKANTDGMYVYFDINTEYIEQAFLDNFEYVIYKFDRTLGSDGNPYVDVSTPGGRHQMFEIKPIWDEKTAPDYDGKIEIKLLDNVDLSGSYYIAATIENTLREATISDLRNLFNWQIANYTIGSVYTGENFAGEEETIQLEGIYNNLDEVNINVSLLTVYENDVNWTINKSCIDSNNEDACGPEGISYNAAFTDNGNNSGETGILTLTMKENVADSDKLMPGTYSLVLYYGNDNYRFVNFDVKSEYAGIEIGDPYIYSIVGKNSDGTDKKENGLYQNLNGFVDIGLTLRGIEYDYQNLNLRITNASGNNVTSDFLINSSKFATNKTLSIGYTTTSGLPSGDYMVTISYATKEEIVSDSFSFDIKEGYFNFHLSDPSYTPEKLYPNLEDGGAAIFKVTTENIANVFLEGGDDNEKTQKHVIAGNTIITNSEGNNVTDQFIVTASNNNESMVKSNFDLKIAYEQNAIEPGYYTIETHYELYNYVIKKEQEFVVGDYVKDLKITKTEIITATNDGRMHKNVNGTYRVYYATAFDLIGEYFDIAIMNSDGEDVTDRFEISDQGTYVDFRYVATEPYIDSGEYTIIMTYQEDDSIDAFIISTTVRMYGIYKDITLKNLQQSSDTIYADIDDQYLTFEVESASMTTEDKNNLIFKVYDAEENIVYSDLDSDNVRNQFTFTNSINTSQNVKIDIEPFKARVGEYTVIAYLEDEDGEYNFSNSLVFEIDYTYYRVTISSDSYINPQIDYGDKSIYDVDGADVFFKFTSTYPASSNPTYSIRLYKGLKFYREYITEYSTVDDDGLKYFVTETLTGEIDAATYDFAISINGLPYEWITEEVKEYITATSAKIVIDGDQVAENGTINVFAGTTLDISVLTEPVNATDQEFSFMPSDPGVAYVDTTTGKIIISGTGSTELVAKNRDLSIKINIVADLRIASSTYKIDYDNYIIHVDIIRSTTLPKSQFLANLTGLVDNYKLLNYSGVDVTSSATTIGTGMKVQNGKEIYSIAVIGDLNRDAKINVYDVSMLYQHIRGKRKITDKVVLKAADIRKLNTINVYDVSKLYQFVRGKRTSL